MNIGSPVGVAQRRSGRVLGGVLLTAAAMLLVPSAGFAAPQDLDPHFGGTGKLTTDVGAHDFSAAVAIDTQGRIVVAGSTADGPQGDFLVARYMRDGSLDGSFGSGGIVTTDFKGRDDRAGAMGLDSQGRIIVAGTSLRNGISLAAVARYQADGTRDSSFSGDGKVLVNLGTYESAVNAMVVDSQDRIVVAGRRYLYHDPYDSHDFALARLMPNGSLDPSFGGDGKVSTNFGQVDIAYALALDSHGRIVAAGESEFETSSFIVARYAPNGTLDPSFGEPVNFGGDVYSDYALAVTVDRRGRVLAAGGADRLSGASDFSLVRYASGKLDPSFGTGGTLTTAFADYAAANAVMTDHQGRIVAVGSEVHFNPSRGEFALARYGPDGALDPSFGVAGTVTTAFGWGNEARANDAVIDSRDRIVAVGSVYNGSGTDLALARYTGKDRTPPDVTIKGRHKVRTRHRRARARFRFTASEPASFRCAIDGERARGCSSPYRTPRLATGHHRLKVLATDSAGNTGSATKRFRIVRRR